MKFLLIFLLPFLLFFSGCQKSQKDYNHLNIAAEFVAHSAPYYIAKSKKWYQEAGLKIKGLTQYQSGMALSAALSRGEIDAAYICLIPAIIAFKNGSVKLKVVLGTHLYGYGLVVNPQKIKKATDLINKKVIIAAPREGSPADIFMHRFFEKNNIPHSVIKNVRRMAPAKIIQALYTHQVDAAFIPEHYPSLAQGDGFQELAHAKQVWPKMQGSVLVVKESLLHHHPEVVAKLVKITRRGLDYIRTNPQESAQIIAQSLSIGNSQITNSRFNQNPTPKMVNQSIYHRMFFTDKINPDEVQRQINYIHQLGYISSAFKSDLILDSRFMNEKD